MDFSPDDRMMKPINRLSSERAPTPRRAGVRAQKPPNFTLMVVSSTLRGIET
jgi:hypothetical protein